MMRCLRILAAAVLVSQAAAAHAQTDSDPVKIRVRRIVFKAGNEYSVDIPDLEFHMLIQKQYDIFNSSITADYDFSRKDMGFGMSHALNKFLVNPGISVDDNLYFREVFNDSTGIWSRVQSIAPFLVHQYSDHTTLGMNFIFQREWSPKRREGADIVHHYDYSIRLVYHYQISDPDAWEATILTISAERSFRIFRGQYNHFLLDVSTQFARELNTHIRYKNNSSFSGNVTPQRSPLYFLGGPRTLIGYEKDEFWGRRIMYTQNLIELMPHPERVRSLWRAEIRRFAILFQFDIGRVEGASHIEGLRDQDNKVKYGMGIGFGFDTDLPYMPDTSLHFMLGQPIGNPGGAKFYAGFGGWLK